MDAFDAFSHPIIVAGAVAAALTAIGVAVRGVWRAWDKVDKFIDSVVDRLKRLERRVERIEHRLGIHEEEDY